MSDTISGEVDEFNVAKLHMLAHALWCSAFESGWSRRALGKDRLSNMRHTVQTEE